ncbi:MAG: 4-alpha-glucanotransferase, partial [Oscillospiraceae bacterium]
YLPHNYTRHCVVYTGTHDNDTILGWFEGASAQDAAFAIDYLRLNPEEGYGWGMMKAAWASVGELAVVTMQDLLGLGREARMNTPSTLGANWCWRMPAEAGLPALAEKLRRQMTVYRRLPDKNA